MMYLDAHTFLGSHSVKFKIQLPMELKLCLHAQAIHASLKLEYISIKLKKVSY